MPYFGVDPARTEMDDYHISTGYLYTQALNECLHNHPEANTRGILEQCRVALSFDLERFWFCLTGLKKDIYYGVYGWDAGDYLEVFDLVRVEVERAVAELSLIHI